MCQERPSNKAYNFFEYFQKDMRAAALKEVNGSRRGPSAHGQLNVMRYTALLYILVHSVSRGVHKQCYS